MYDKTPFTAAHVTFPGEGIDSRSLGRHRILATGEQTGGAVSIWEEVVEPGWGPPLHVHHREDEVFHILEGAVRMWCGEEIFDAEPGAVVVLPRGVAHRFENVGDTQARMLVVCTPGGFDGFFRDLDAIPGFTPEDIGAAAARHGLEFVG